MTRLEYTSGPVATGKTTTASQEETVELGRRLGEALPLGTTVSLEGGLGAGKTALVKGIALGLGIEAEVLSPTFILVEEYRGGAAPMLHYDLYRLEELGEVERIGMFDAVDGRNVVVVEWGDRLPEGTMDFDVTVSIRITGGSGRELDFTAPAPLLEALEIDREAGGRHD
jgi:tRNA threonylcarbamoyladenosine biosynthesis protein TsaE